MRPGHHRRLPNHVIGAILLALIAIGSFLAYTKKLPWSHGYEIKAVFTTAENVRVDSPVRIAGVNVGEVTGVEHCTVDNPACRGTPGASSIQAAAGKASRPPSTGATGTQAAIVTMEISDEGRPIKEDATFTLRPRLFLEGNLFVDVHPGSPQSPEAPDGHVFPVTQTAASVQLDQVLSSLQGGVRHNLQLFLKEFGDALIKYNGAQGFRELYATSPGAYKYTSQVNQAFLGTEPHDLSSLVENLDRTVRALDADETGLQNLVTNLRIVTGSFAAQNEALEAAIAELPDVLAAGRPALRHLDHAFPPLRAFAREALPGVRSTPETLDAAMPLLRQIRGLVSKPELRGLVHDLRPTIPRLTKLSARTIPFLNQSRALSSCFNESIIPWSNSVVPDPDIPPPTITDAAGTHPATVSEETGYGLVGIAGESRSGDANGQYIRVEAGGGANTPVLPGPINGGVGQIIENSQPASQTVPFVGFAESQILGSRPNLAAGHEDSLKTPFRPDAPCERQSPPNLQSTQGPAPEQTPVGAGNPSSLPPVLQGLGQASLTYLKNYERAQQLTARGKSDAADALIKKASEAWLRYEARTKPQLQAELPSAGGTPSQGGIPSLGGAK
jgi:phospholipid/cholesterol/gamma-HCH transport system substrate-binding protein